MTDNLLLPGTRVIGDAYTYVIKRVLGQGAFGITYLASVKLVGTLGSIDANIDVALKEFFMRGINGREVSVVTSSRNDGVFAYYKEKFIHEARNIGRLEHPNIIKVLEVFEGNNTVYYAMEFIDGGSLDNRIAEAGRLSEAECIGYTVQIGAALSYMHSEHMLHLDLKPNNIMLRSDGTAVLIDFGLAKHFDSYGNPEISTSVGLGTPGYAPIEQAHYRAMDSKTFPATMDVYSLGATMFKMLTGQCLPEASDILNYGFPAHELTSRKVSPALCAVIEKAMSPAKSSRFQAITDLLADLPKIEQDTLDIIAPGGCYKKIIRENDYDTDKIILQPVTESIPFPDSITIKCCANDGKDFSYEIHLMTCNDLCEPYVKIWYNGNLVHENILPGGIPDDVKGFLVSHGFLSTFHWENEEYTGLYGNIYGYDVSIVMSSKGEAIPFIRRVKSAHYNYHRLLLCEIDKLVCTTSLRDYVYPTFKLIDKANTDGNVGRRLFRGIWIDDKLSTDYTALDNTADVVVLKDVEMRKIRKFQIEMNPIPVATTITVDFSSPCIGPYGSLHNDKFHYVITENKIGNVDISAGQYRWIIQQINALNITCEISYKHYNKFEYSEVPGSLEIKLYDKNGLYDTASLFVFGNDICCGNIIGENLYMLKDKLVEIIKQSAVRRENTPIWNGNVNN